MQFILYKSSFFYADDGTVVDTYNIEWSKFLMPKVSLLFQNYLFFHQLYYLAVILDPVCVKIPYKGEDHWMYNRIEYFL